MTDKEDTKPETEKETEEKKEEKEVEPKEEEEKELTEAEKEIELQKKLAKRNQERAKKYGSREFVWKNTMEDGFLPFKHITENDKEYAKKQLKDFEDPFEFTGEYMTLNITKLGSKDVIKPESKQKFDLKSIVYCKDLNNYVQIKKFDDEKLTYTCREVGENKEDVQLEQSKLSKYIKVLVSLIKGIDYEQGNEAGDISELKVSINEKLQKINDIFALDGQGGFMMTGGQLINNPDETTFQKNFIKDLSKFVVVSSSSSGKCTKWVRFPEYYLTDYYYMNTRYWDAVVFIPKRNIIFHGFGVFANYNNKDLTYKVGWNINDADSDEYEIAKVDADKCVEKKWHEINLKELGVKPIKVAEGTKIHCKIRVTDDDHRRCFYGYSGYKDRYSVIPDQEYDFDMDYSSFNDNSTSADWGQIPFILYSPA